MTSIIYKNSEVNERKFSTKEHEEIFNNYINGAYDFNKKRVQEDELYLLPKIFIYKNTIDIVTGDQSRGGKTYLKHLNLYDKVVDREHGVVLLIENDEKKVEHKWN